MKAVPSEAGRPKAQVQLLTNPRVRGYDNAVKTIREDLVDASGSMDLWLFFPDADLATPDAMTALEGDLGRSGVGWFRCPAVPEMEIYACAAYRPVEPGTWEEWRSQSRLKETVFPRLLKGHGDPKPSRWGRGSSVEQAPAKRHRIADYLAE